MNRRAELKAATRVAHERVDAAFAVHDLSRADSYGRFLVAQAAALLPIERALEQAGADRLVEGWADHRRGPLLVEDLAELGLAVPLALAAPAFDDEPAMAGGLYVLEGSRMGGAMLRRRVPGDQPTAFLSASQSPGRWTRFVTSLDRLLYSPQRVDGAVRAALASFACFERAAARASTGRVGAA